MSVRHALLALLSEGPKYGLQLREEFEDRTGEVWPLNVGQVYTTLQRLERDGFVESDGTGEGPAEGLPDHRQRRGRAGPLAADAAGPELAAPGRAGDEGAGGDPAAGCGRARGDPGAPALPGGADAGMDADQGKRRRRMTSISRSRWMPSCSGSTRSSAGSTRPTGGSSGPRPTDRSSRLGRSSRTGHRCRSSDGA